MMYDVSKNTYDLTVTLNGFSDPLTASHIHEQAPGTAGPVVSPLGDETAYTRTGNTLTATFRGLTYGGTPLTLLQNGSYVNFHTATYKNGEIRGQLIAQPVWLTAVATGSGAGTTSEAYGAALIAYDPGTNKISTRINLYNFTNALINSHYHEGAPGVNGPVVHPLGSDSVYTRTGNSYGAVFSDQTYGGDPVVLLTGGAYLNFHSDVNKNGEIRGQVTVSSGANAARLVNVSARGSVGTGEQVLITGFVISGTEPVRVLVTAKGGSLGALGVSSPLADPQLSLHDWSGREIVANDNFADGFSSGDIAGTGFAPMDAGEAALLLVLPPGIYTSVVSGAGDTTGVALAEVYEVRPTTAAP
jgi:hypothetical protein